MFEEDGFGGGGGGCERGGRVSLMMLRNRLARIYLNLIVDLYGTLRRMDNFVANVNGGVVMANVIHTSGGFC